MRWDLSGLSRTREGFRGERSPEHPRPRTPGAPQPQRTDPAPHPGLGLPQKLGGDWPSSSWFSDESRLWSQTEAPLDRGFAVLNVCVSQFSVRPTGG